MGCWFSSPSQKDNEKAVANLCSSEEPLVKKCQQCETLIPIEEHVSYYGFCKKCRGVFNS